MLSHMLYDKNELFSEKWSYQYDGLIRSDSRARRFKDWLYERSARTSGVKSKQL